MNANRPTASLDLSPACQWRKLFSDGERNVWITRASYDNVKRFSPSDAILPHDSFHNIANTLRQIDYAAYVISDNRTGTSIAECRPRSGDRLYISEQSGGVNISSGICNLRHQPSLLSRRFFATWLANALRFGSFDHYLGTSPFENVHLVTQGIRLEGTNNLLSTPKTTADLPRETTQGSSPQEAIARFRSALIDAVEMTSSFESVFAECSGGIDSSLIAALAQRASSKNFKAGIFVNYPYKEFQKESQYAEQVATLNNFPLLAADPAIAIPWGAVICDRTRDAAAEPSQMIPFWGQVLASSDTVGRIESTAILNGLGGDLLFQDRELAFSFETPPDWLNQDLWKEICDTSQSILSWIQAPGNESAGYGFSNPWASQTLSQIRPDLIYFSPMCQRAVIDSAINLRKTLARFSPFSQSSLSSIQKPLAYLPFSQYLPISIWNRRWKVNFVGNYYRAWMTTGNALIKPVANLQRVLKEFGINTSRVLRHIKGMSCGRRSADRLLNSLVTYCYWLDNYLQ